MKACWAARSSRSLSASARTRRKSSVWPVGEFFCKAHSSGLTTSPGALWPSRASPNRWLDLAMPRPATSQWDFGGELFSKEAMRRVFSVSELTADIRRLLERNFGQLWVSGEITNCRTQSSGHLYFTLKDVGAQMSCVLFRTDPVVGREALQDGQKVVIKGELTVYEPRGQYQLHVLAVE